MRIPPNVLDEARASLADVSQQERDTLVEFCRRARRASDAADPSRGTVAEGAQARDALLGAL